MVNEEESGKSLIEIIVCLGVLVSILCISLPSNGHYINEHRLTSFAKRITSLLNTLPSLSQIKNQTLTFGEESQFLNIKENQNSLLKIKIPDRLSVKTSGLEKLIYFYPDNVAKPGKIIINHKNSLDSCLITTSLRGRSRYSCNF